MNFKVCLVLSLAVLVLAVCVSADRAHVERVKGAPKGPGRILESESRGDFDLEEFSTFVNAVRTRGERADEESCNFCMEFCTTQHCVDSPDCVPEDCPHGCCHIGYCPPDSHTGACPDPPSP